MAEVKWIKLSVNTFDDEKIKLIKALPEGNALIVIWCQLLCLAGKVNDSGYIYIGQNMPYTDEMLATIFNEPVNNVRLALQTFQQFGMIENTEHGLFLVNWGSYQNLDGMDKIREGNRVRNIEYRQRRRLTGEHDITHDITVTSHDALEEERRKKNKSKNNTTPTPSKINYAERVTMLESEYATLTQELGKEGADRCIAILDTYKGANGKQYKSDYLAIKNWVIQRYKEEAAKAVKVGIAPPPPAVKQPTVIRYQAIRHVEDGAGRRLVERSPGVFISEEQARAWAGDDGEVSSIEVAASYQQPPVPPPKPAGSISDLAKGLSAGWRTN